jgi:hypothetical protein
MWCTDFVAWVYRAAEVPFDGGEGGWQVQNNFAAREWFKSRGLWIDREHDSWELFEPQPGDYVRIHTSRYGHSAIVARTEGDTLFTIEGNFTNSVRLIRHTRFRSDIRIDGFGMLALDNATPTVDAGADDLVAWSDHVVHLAGSVSDDGPNEELTVSWSRKEGPGRVIFEDPWAPSTWATFTEPGVYVLELAADDGALYATDQIVVELTEPESATSDAEGLDAAPRAAGCAATGLSGDDGTGDMASLLALVIFVSNRRRRVLRV